MGLFSSLYTDEADGAVIHRTPTGDLASGVADGRSVPSEVQATSTVTELHDELTRLCLDTSLTAAEAIAELSEDDLDDWNKGKTSIDTLGAFVQSLVNHRMIEEGQVPLHFTERATCARCGPIWYWIAVDVSGCPWCWNRLHGRPVPRP